jgi:hypothetical protein
VTVGDGKYIGKEANELLEREAGMNHDLGEVLSTFEDPESSEWQDLVRRVPTATLMRATGRDRSTIKRWKAGSSRPRLNRRSLDLRVLR